MRVNVNLATQPFEDAQEFVRRSLTILVVLFVVTLGLVWYTARSYLGARDLNRQIATVRNEIKTLDRESQHARTVLARPENHATVQRSEFLNAVFARKAFSWTTVFSDMEKIMPHGLYVVSIQPSLTENKELHVAIVVAGSSRDRAGELVRSMEKLSRFRDVTLLSETVPDPNASGGPSREEVQYTIAALYQPSAPDTPADNVEGGQETGDRNTAKLGEKR